MKRSYLAGLAIGVSFVITGCSDTPPPVPDTRAADEKAIRDGEVAWNAEFKAKDADKILSHYANDANFMTPNGPPARGREAIRTGITALLADKNLALSFTAAKVEVAKSSDIAYSQGTYSLTVTNPKTKKPLNETGTYVTVYKKQEDHSWKAIEDINTPDGAAASAPAPKAAGKKKAARHKK